MAEQNEILSTIMYCRRNRKNPNERSFIIKTKYGYTYVVALDCTIRACYEKDGVITTKYGNPIEIATWLHNVGADIKTIAI